MDYETWNAHTTELQNKYGYTGKSKKGSFAEVSLYEFINYYLPEQLVWQIFSYTIEPNLTKKEIINHYEGKGQRVWIPRFRPCGAVNRGVGEWVLRGVGRMPGTHILTPEHRVNRTKKFNKNIIVDFLTRVRKNNGYGHVYTWPTDPAMHCPQRSLIVNKVKGRTKLIKDYRKRFRSNSRTMLEQEQDLLRHIANGGTTVTFNTMIRQEKDQYDNDKAVAAMAMCHAIQAI